VVVIGVLRAARQRLFRTAGLRPAPSVSEVRHCRGKAIAMNGRCGGPTGVRHEDQTRETCPLVEKIFSRKPAQSEENISQSQERPAAFRRLPAPGYGPVPESVPAHGLFHSCKRRPRIAGAGRRLGEWSIVDVGVGGLLKSWEHRSQLANDIPSTEPHKVVTRGH